MEFNNTNLPLKLFNVNKSFQPKLLIWVFKKYDLSKHNIDIFLNTGLDFDAIRYHYDQYTNDYAYGWQLSYFIW